MRYTLSDFCSDLSATLKSKGENGLPEIARKLSELLGNPAFVGETFSEDTPVGRRELWHDPATDVYVLAHVQEGGKVGNPHTNSSARSIYVNDPAVTEMTECRRVNPASEDGVVLKKTEHYALGPGQTRSYSYGLIHSTAHPQKAWVIRVTGTDLDAIPRYHFRAKTDKILEGV
jgi:hypothetical protein